MLLLFTDALQTYFGKFGDILECMIMRDPVTRRSRSVITSHRSHSITNITNTISLYVQNHMTVLYMKFDVILVWPLEETMLLVRLFVRIEIACQVNTCACDVCDMAGS